MMQISLQESMKMKMLSLGKKGKIALKRCSKNARKNITLNKIY